jgi:hypothetical protein
MAGVHTDRIACTPTPAATRRLGGSPALATVRAGHHGEFPLPVGAWYVARPSK